MENMESLMEGLDQPIPLATTSQFKAICAAADQMFLDQFPGRAAAAGFSEAQARDLVVSTNAHQPLTSCITITLVNCVVGTMRAIVRGLSMGITKDEESMYQIWLKFSARNSVHRLVRFVHCGVDFSAPGMSWPLNITREFNEFLVHDGVASNAQAVSRKRNRF